MQAAMPCSPSLPSDQPPKQPPGWPPNQPVGERHGRSTRAGLHQVHQTKEPLDSTAKVQRLSHVRARNRRKRYLDTHPDYFGPELELADPLLYQRLVRQFQSADERQAEGRARGFSRVLEADLWRGEARMAQALHTRAQSRTAPDRPRVRYSQDASGSITAHDAGNDEDDSLTTREQGRQLWVDEMTQRFLQGNDSDFDYSTVDESSEYDDVHEETRAAEDLYFDSQRAEWSESFKGTLQGETGIQDF